MELVQKLLLEAIEGESGAELRYKQFADKARAEEFKGVALLFTALSRAEAIHIANHQRALKKNGFSGTIASFSPDINILSTSENLHCAIAAEYEEFRTMYPSFRRQIKSGYGDQFEAKIALLSIQWACETEETHYKLLKQALASVSSDGDMTHDYYLCSVCGNIHYSQAPPEILCSICGHDLSFYNLVKGSE